MPTIVVCMEDLLIAIVTERDEEQAMEEPSFLLPDKELGKGVVLIYYTCDANITRDRKARKLKFVSTPLHASGGDAIRN